MRARVSLGLILLMAVDGLTAQSTATSSAPDAPQFVRTLHEAADLTGKPLPGGLVKAIAQEGIDLNSFRGHPVVISYWATWCRSCEAGLADANRLASSGSIAAVAIDFDRDPAKAHEYLATHHISLRNIHDDGSLRASARLSLTPPFALSIVLDANGRVIFAQSSMYRDELRAAIASLGAEYAEEAKTAVPVQTGNGGDLTADQIRQAAISAVQYEPGYLSEQRKFVCQYDVKTLRHYGGGRSTSSEEQMQEVLATESGHILTKVLGGGQSSQGDEDAQLASNSFAIWKDPILSSVLEHSLISNVRVVEPGGKNTTQNRYAYFTYRGDPAFQPANDTDRVAQSMEGSMALELNHNVLLVIDGFTQYDVTADKRFLVERYMPLLSFDAVPYQGVFLPSVWSETWFTPVGDGAGARRRWQETLVRTFGERKGCKEFEVNSAILPGFEVVPKTSK
jgi:thiol-disulfide isomerase/thioredoxin